jgi:hypothetical protein
MLCLLNRYTYTLFLSDVSLLLASCLPRGSYLVLVLFGLTGWVSSCIAITPVALRVIATCTDTMPAQLHSHAFTHSFTHNMNDKAFGCHQDREVGICGTTSVVKFAGEGTWDSVLRLSVLYALHCIARSSTLVACFCCLQQRVFPLLLLLHR